MINGFLLTIFIVFSSFFAGPCFALPQEVWLQDINCKIMYAKDKNIYISTASLVNYICIINKIDVVCSISAVNPNDSFDAKPSKILTYKIIGDAKLAAFMLGNDHNQTILLDFQSNEYNSSQTTLLPQGLITKNCVGIIKHEK